MPVITVSEQFNCTPELAFATLSDFQNYPNFIEAIVSANMQTEHTSGIGVKFSETRMMMGREATEEMEVIEFSAPSRFVLYSFAHGTEYHSVHTFEPNENGTKVTLEFRAKPKTLMAKIMSGLFSRMIAQVADMLQKDLGDAKAEAEKRAA